MLDEIEVLGEIPEDPNVQRAIASRTPVISHSPRSRASQEIKRAAANLIGREYLVPKPWHEKVFGFLRR